MSKKNILKLFLNYYPNYKVDEIKELRFEKYLIIARKKNNFYVFKLSLNNFSIKLIINEFNGYTEYKKFKAKNFSILDLKKLTFGKKYPSIQSKFINMKKGSFFNFKILFLKKNKINFKTKTCKHYVEELLNKDFLCEQKISLDLKEKVSYIKNSYGKHKLYLCLSHGDLVHFNTFVSQGKTFVYDFEFYKKDRALYFDFFHWFIVPFFSKFKKFKNLTILTHLASIYLKIIINIFENKNKLSLKIKISTKDFKIYLLIFLLEKILFCKKINKLHYKNKLNFKTNNSVDAKLYLFYQKLFEIVKNW